MQPKVAPAVASARQNFYSKIDEQNYAALWNVLSDIITPEPKSACIPYMWRFAEAKNYILEAGNLITAAEAERRVLILENPGLRGKSSITTSLYAGIQLVMPGEIAPAHRHSQSAVRLVLEAGPGAYTAVNGERTTMHYGDFILTPPNHWHDHGNTGAEPVIWLDGLDIPMISHFDTSFIDHHNEDAQPITKKEGDSSARYGANMLPVDFKPGELASPIFNYPYARSREALEAMRRQNESGSLPRPQDAFREPGRWRLCDADRRRVHAVAAEGLQDRRLSQHRRHSVRADTRARPHNNRRQDLRMGAKGRHRHAELEMDKPRSRRGRGAVQLVRPRRPGEARPVAAGPRQCQGRAVTVLEDSRAHPMDDHHQLSRHQRVLTMPGHLLRRCQQIAVALFLDECAPLNLTPLQFVVLSALADHGARDQASLGGLTATDRTTVQVVLGNLRKLGLVPSPNLASTSAPRSSRSRRPGAS